MPVWGGTSTPYGKGLDYLSRHEARDPEKLARSQLAGLKLLLLGLLWLWALEGIDVAFFGEAGTGLITTRLDAWGADLPRLRTLVRNDVDTSIAAAWAVVYLELVRVTLVLAGAGHVIVGCLRLLGFNVYRNTYKPFLSESIVEFWNRYYYYFKEVLVEFFFYPTFVRCAAAGPRLRLFLAVFAAAFAGNMYFHLVAHPGAIVAGDFVLVWETWGSRVFYCFLLASGIWISMLRQKKHRASPPPSGIVRRLARIAFVLSFYALIQIWNVNAHAVGTIERFEFLTSLLGI